MEFTAEDLEEAIQKTEEMIFTAEDLEEAIQKMEEMIKDPPDHPKRLTLGYVCFRHSEDDAQNMFTCASFVVNFVLKRDEAPDEPLETFLLRAKAAIPQLKELKEKESE